MEAVQKLDAANALDKKTKAFAYLAVLAASGLAGGCGLALNGSVVLAGLSTV